MNELQMINRMLFSKEKRSMLELLDNTNGNADGLWVDSSPYHINAIQSNTTITPNYVPDLFGAGKNGYSFNAGDFFSIPMGDRFILGNGGGSQAFTVEMTVIFTSTTTVSRNIIQKYQNATGYADWQIVLYGGMQIRFYVYSEGNPAVYIRCVYTWTPVVNQVYNLKFVYTGGGSAFSCMIYIDGVSYSTTRGEAGTFVRIGNTPQPINIGRTVYLPVENVTNVKYTEGVI